MCSTAEQEVGLCTEAARSSGQEPPAPLMVKGREYEDNIDVCASEGCSDRDHG